MINKLNLKTHDRVKLVNVGAQGVALEDRFGSVIGVATRHIIDFYIIQLDDPFELDGFLHIAVSFPETCLVRV